MRKIIVFTILLVGCSSNQGVRNTAEFDWMPNDLLWQQNIRDCRSQPMCDPAQLFRRT